MYNRYITESGQPQQKNAARSEAGYAGDRSIFGAGQQWLRQLGDALNLFGGEAKNAGIAGILKGFGLENLDSGDVLLLLILLLVFLEGDNMELVITLGLMLLLGEEETQNE